MTTQDLSAKTSSQQTGSQIVNLRNLALLLVVVGLFISGYISYNHLSNTQLVCPGESGAELAGRAINCDAVTTSRYSRMFGIPIAYLGFGMYLTLGVLLFLEKRIPLLQDYGRELTFGIALFAWLYSMYLVYLQFFVIGAVCLWCLSHEANMTILFIVITARLMIKMFKPEVEEAA